MIETSGLALPKPLVQVGVAGEEEAVAAFLDRFPGKLDEYETLITKNPIWLDRTRGVGVISYDDCCKWGLFGPIARAASVPDGSGAVRWWASDACQVTPRSCSASTARISASS